MRQVVDTVRARAIRYFRCAAINVIFGVSIGFSTVMSNAVARNVDARFDGDLGVGGGGTYQFDGTSTSAIGAVTWTCCADRFEIGAFRFVKSQLHNSRRDVSTYAKPNWVFPVSSRWTLLRSGEGALFIGIGDVYKTETDELNGSHFNFTEQLGYRVTPLWGGPAVEIVLRHMSNAGLKKPNRGQDFITVEVVF